MVVIWLRDSRAFLPMPASNAFNVRPQFRMEQVPDYSASVTLCAFFFNRFCI